MRSFIPTSFLAALSLHWGLSLAALTAIHSINAHQPYEKDGSTPPYPANNFTALTIQDDYEIHGISYNATSNGNAIIHSDAHRLIRRAFSNLCKLDVAG
ncbi:hypothetical protein K469DRAFT_709806 [Zopfia rhizophila CBS 207.26]|uniref:Uncharacterized protein n=1 Tax=Zopfia rhizophila CBS 207.26 TaxID=1314779 RepID=A0A6A6ESZ3_9PEZI|nr:hypothetical protein K469DRAFT_709806 [Zopfia rhizophila CBS 207.26]